MSPLVELTLGLLVGFGLGFLGSLTGIGGGFLLMPFLLAAFPTASPGSLSLISLAVVLLNASVGTGFALRAGRLKWGPTLGYAALGLPLVWWGAEVQTGLATADFRLGFGAFLVAGSALLALEPGRRGVDETRRPRWALGAVLVPPLAFAASVFGVGGGFLYVPLLVVVVGLPVLEATALGQALVGFGALVAWAIAAGHHPVLVAPTLAAGLALGVVGGAATGATVAPRVPGPWILRILALLLALVGASFVIDGLWPPPGP